MRRFMDDTFMIFPVITKQVQSMNYFMKNLHSTIKFTFKHSTQEMLFLDMKIHIRTDCKLSPQTVQPDTENPLTALHFYIYTPTTHSNAKRALFSHKPLDTITSFQITPYYKASLILSQYLSLPENTL